MGLIDKAKEWMWGNAEEAIKNKLEAHTGQSAIPSSVEKPTISGNNTELINSIKGDLTHLKEAMKSDHISQEEKDTCEQSLLDGLSPIFDKIQTLDKKNAFWEILQKLKDPDKRIEETDFDKINTLLDGIADTELLNALKEKLQKTREQINQGKSDLTALRQELPAIPDNPITKFKKEFTDWKQNFLNELKEHPFVGRLGMSMLPQGLKELVLKEVDGDKGPDKVDSLIDSVGGMLGGVAEMFAPFILWLLGSKNLKDLMDQIGKLREKAPQEVKDLKILDEGNSLTQGIQQAEETLKNKEDLKKAATHFKAETMDYVKNKLGKKDVDDQKLSTYLDSFLDKHKDNFAPHASELLDAALNKKPGVKYGVLESMKDIMNGAGIMIDFVGGLIDIGTLSYTDIAFSFAKESYEYGVISLGLVKDELSIFAGQITLEDLQNRFEKIKMSEGEKILLSYMIYRKGGLFFDLLGSMAKMTSHIALWPFVYAKQDVGQFRASWYVWSGNFQKQKQIIEFFNIRLGDQALIDSNPRLRALSDDFTKMGKFYDFWDFYTKNQTEFQKSGQKLGEFLQQRNAAIFDISKGFLSEYELGLVGNPENIKSIRGVVSANISNIGKKAANSTSDFLSAVGGFFKGSLSEKAVIDNFASDIVKISKTTESIVKNDDIFNSVRNIFDKYRLSGQVGEAVEHADDLFFKFESVDDLKKWGEELKILARKSPSTLKFILQKIPIITVAGIGASEISKKEKLDDKVLEVGKFIGSLVPFVGPMMLFADSGMGLSTGEDGKLKMEGNLAQASASAILFGLDTMFLVNTIVKGKSITKFVFSPIVDTLELIGGISKATRYGAKFAVDTARVFGTLAKEHGVVKTFSYMGKEIKFAERCQMLFSKLKNPKLATALLLLTFGSYEVLKEMGYFDSPEMKHMKEMLESGDIQTFQQEVPQMWKTLNDEDKQYAIRQVILLKLTEAGVSDSIKEKDIYFDPKTQQIRISSAKFLSNADMAFISKDLFVRFQKFDIFNNFENGLNYNDIIVSVDIKVALDNLSKDNLGKDYTDLNMSEKANIRNLIKEVYGYSEEQMKEIIV